MPLYNAIIIWSFWGMLINNFWDIKWYLVEFSWTPTQMLLLLSQLKQISVYYYWLIYASYTQLVRNLLSFCIYTPQSTPAAFHNNSLWLNDWSYTLTGCPIYNHTPTQSQVIIYRCVHLLEYMPQPPTKACRSRPAQKWPARKSLGKNKPAQPKGTTISVLHMTSD